MFILSSHWQRKLTDDVNVYDYLLNKSNVLERLNKHVVAKGKQLDLSGNGMWMGGVCECMRLV